MIETYGEYVEDYETSVFESVYFILHNRSHLEKVLDELTHEDRIKLLEFDLKLIQNAKKMADYIGRSYYWSNSKKNLTVNFSSGIWIGSLKGILHSIYMRKLKQKLDEKGCYKNTLLFIIYKELLHFFIT